MLPRNHPDRIQITFVANAGLILPATLALHLGLSQLVQQGLDLGNAPGAGQHRRQDNDAGRFRAGWRRLHRRRRCVRSGGAACARGSVVKAPSTLGDLPTQLPVGPRPPTGPGEPRAAGPGSVPHRRGPGGRVRATASGRRPLGNGTRQESAERALGKGEWT